MTLRTFHLGGTSSRIASQSQVESAVNGIVKFNRINSVEKEGFFGKSLVVTGRRGSVEIYDENDVVVKKYDVPYGAELHVREGTKVTKKTALYNHDPYNSLIITDIAGKVKFRDLYDNNTIQQITDEQTGHVQKVVIESKDKNLTPSIEVISLDGTSKTFNLPIRAFLSVEEGEEISAGTILVKISKQASKSRDITGGLPRVTELFEARSPHEPAVVSEIEGIVKFGAKKKGSREIFVVAIDESDQKKYNVPLSKHVLVQEGDEIPAGEKITDGPINPHDILKINGTNAVQEYLLNEIQDVYRLQGVKINDKHIEVIVRQMLQKLRIVDSGDSKFLEDDTVDRYDFFEENQRMMNSSAIVTKGDSKLKEGQVVSKAKLREIEADLKRKAKKEVEVREAKPATFEHILLGITQAALSTESFISAASFQETTKVLTNAAIAAKNDTLRGLKENVVMGQLIPAGTGLKKYKNIILKSAEQEVTESADVSQEA